MTNYNERLDEILQGELVCISNDPQAYVAGIEDTKQALTSLTKELVAEAKPAMATISDDELGVDRARKSAANQAINQLEQNLLKALEEV